MLLQVKKDAPVRGKLLDGLADSPENAVGESLLQSAASSRWFMSIMPPALPPRPEGEVWPPSESYEVEAPVPAPAATPEPEEVVSVPTKQPKAEGLLAINLEQDEKEDATVKGGKDITDDKGDGHRSGEMDQLWSEFLPGVTREALIKNFQGAFDQFDTSGDGTIDRAEWGNLSNSAINILAPPSQSIAADDKLPYVSGGGNRAPAYGILEAARNTDDEDVGAASDTDIARELDKLERAREQEIDRGEALTRSELNELKKAEKKLTQLENSELATRRQFEGPPTDEENSSSEAEAKGEASRGRARLEAWRPKRLEVGGGVSGSASGTEVEGSSGNAMEAPTDTDMVVRSRLLAPRLSLGDTTQGGKL